MTQNDGPLILFILLTFLEINDKKDFATLSQLLYNFLLYSLFISCLGFYLVCHVFWAQIIQL